MGREDDDHEAVKDKKRKHLGICLEISKLVKFGDGMLIGGLEVVRVDGGVVTAGGFGVALWGDPLEVLPRLHLTLHLLVRRHMSVAPVWPRQRQRHISLSLDLESAVQRIPALPFGYRFYLLGLQNEMQFLARQNIRRTLSGNEPRGSR